MTQSVWMQLRWISAFALAVASLAGMASGQDESLRADAPHPRILLGARRLRLLRRERERQSMRWNQFHLLIAGKAPMPEPGFAQALYYQVSGDAEAGRQAIAWALGPGADLRQLALAFDWCQDILTEAQSKNLAAKIARGMQQSRRDSSVSAVRSRLLAAVALSGQLPDVPEREIAQVVRTWWEGEILPAINGGREAVARDDAYALMEILHVVRDNFNQDLREGAPHFFTDMPSVQLLSYYPATFPAGENDYRIPAAAHADGQPDLRRATLSRAAELSMVAYDSNAPGSQILQGWLMNDHFLLRGTYGAPYEFLWANPYQPGLSYLQAPLVLHDSAFGRLFVRSSWDESAAWLGFFSRGLQMFQDGAVSVLDPHADAGPLDLGRAMILFGAHTQKFKVAVEGNQPVFVVGLKPRQNYLIEVDDEELSEQQSDPGGILDLDVPHDREVGVRLRMTP
ncbi:MAG: hypothetical protein ABSF64_04640 [Bryobacteraceae bacterium]|jgi:hypothetical protein